MSIDFPRKKCSGISTSNSDAILLCLAFIRAIAITANIFVLAIHDVILITVSIIELAVHLRVLQHSNTTETVADEARHIIKPEVSAKLTASAMSAGTSRTPSKCARIRAYTPHLSTQTTEKRDATM